MTTARRQRSPEELTDAFPVRVPAPDPPFGGGDRGGRPDEHLAELLERLEESERAELAADAERRRQAELERRRKIVALMELARHSPDPAAHEENVRLLRAAWLELGNSAADAPELASAYDAAVMSFRDVLEDRQREREALEEGEAAHPARSWWRGWARKLATGRRSGRIDAGPAAEPRAGRGRG